jgi:ATP-dependent protease ClpP protease subunit/disulfide bond formation protein DsbB
MDYKTSQLIYEWKQRINDHQKANITSAKKYNEFHYVIGVPAIMLAAIAGVILLAEIEEPRFRAVAGIAGIIAAVFSVVQTFYSPVKRSESHRLAVSQLVHIRRDVELFEEFVPESKPERKQRILEIDERISNIAEDTPANVIAIKRWPWILVGFAGSIALVFILLLGSTWFGQIPESQEISVDWIGEAVQLGTETWTFDPGDPLLEQRVILVNTWINEITTQKVVTLLAYFNEQDNRKPITLYLSSIGGYTKDAYAIAHAMQESDAPVDTIALGDCFSACTKILMSGTGERGITQDSRIAIHTHSYEFDGDPYSNNTVLYQREREFFQENSDIPLDWIGREEKFYYLTPEQAITYQLADVIIEYADVDK